MTIQEIAPSSADGRAGAGHTSRRHAGAARSRLVRGGAVALVTAMLVGCATHDPVPPLTGPGGRCSPANSLSVYCP